MSKMFANEHEKVMHSTSQLEGLARETKYIYSRTK